MNRLPLIALTALILLTLPSCGDDDTSPTNAPTPSVAETSPATDPHNRTPSLGPRGWTQLAPMPTPRSEVAVAAVNDLIYVVGGFEASGAPSTRVEVYNPATDTWAAAPDLPRPRHHTAATASDGDLLVTGGFEQSFNDPVATVYRLDIDNGTWSEYPPLTEPRAAHAMTTGLIHTPMVVGGIGSDGNNLATAEQMTWDIEQPELPPEWSPNASMSGGRDHLAAVAAWCPPPRGMSDCVYAIGGRSDLDYSRNLQTNEVAVNPGAWEMFAAMPTARSGTAASPDANFRKIYVFGGEAPSGTFDTVEVYDPETDTWDTAQPMPTARHGMGAAVVNGTIYVIGGGPTPGLSVTGANEAYTP